MPTLRKDIATKELKNAGISKAKMARELGFKNRESFYKHFEKEDIDQDLFMRILTKLKEKGVYIKDSNVTEGDNIENSNLILF